MKNTKRVIKVYYSVFRHCYVKKIRIETPKSKYGNLIKNIEFINPNFYTRYSSPYKRHLINFEEPYKNFYLYGVSI